MPLEEDITGLKIEVATLKQQISAITSLCGKMDSVIDKILDQHERHVTEIYSDMEERRGQTNIDIDKLHNRMDHIIEKLQSSEMNISTKIIAMKEQFTNEMRDHLDYEEKALKKILEWKYLLMGGIIVIVWLLSRLDFDTITLLFKNTH
jgi:DNA anti-recombination protein RmuC